MTTKHKIYLVLEPPPKRHYWKKCVIVKTTRKEPKLKLGQLAIPLEVSIPNNRLEPLPTITVQISAENLIRPEVKVSQG